MTPKVGPGRLLFSSRGRRLWCRRNSMFGRFRTLARFFIWRMCGSVRSKRNN